MSYITDTRNASHLGMFRTGLIVVFLIAVFPAPAAIAQQNFGALGNGDWSDLFNWTGGSGAPGALDNVTIGTTSRFGGAAAATATVRLTANQSVGTLWLGYDSGTAGTIDLNGFHLQTNRIDVGRGGASSSGAGSIAHNGGSFATSILTISGSNSIDLQSGDTVVDYYGYEGSTLSTTSVSNLSGNVNLTGNGTLLTLGTDLELSGNLQLSNGSRLDANSLNISARQVNIDGATILNRGSVDAGDRLGISGGGLFEYRNGDNARTVVSVGTGTVIDINGGGQVETMQVAHGGTLNLNDTTRLAGALLVGNASSLATLGGNLDISGRLALFDNGTLDANGFNIVANEVNVESGASILNRGAINAGARLGITNGRSFDYRSGDIAGSIYVGNVGSIVNINGGAVVDDMQVGAGGTLNINDTSLISRSLIVGDSGSTATLGGNLNLSTSFGLRANSFFDANGFDVSASSIEIETSATILDRGAIRAGGRLDVRGGGMFEFRASDSANSIAALEPGTTIQFQNGAPPVAEAYAWGGGRIQGGSGNIADNFLSIDGDGSRVTLGGDLDTTFVEVGGGANSIATLDGGGHNLNVATLQIGENGYAGELVNHNSLFALQLIVQDRSQFTFTQNDFAAFATAIGEGSEIFLQNAGQVDTQRVIDGGCISVLNAGEINGDLTIFGARSKFAIGGDLVVKGNLSIAGQPVSVDPDGWARFKANGHDVHVKGDFNFGLVDGSPGDALYENNGNLTIDGRLNIANGHFEFGNGKTLTIANVDSLSNPSAIGVASGSEAKFTLSGAGTNFIQESFSFRLGGEGQGTLEVLNGANFGSAGFSSITPDESVQTELRISGLNSVFETNSLLSGVGSYSPSGSTISGAAAGTTVIIENSGLLQSNDSYLNYGDTFVSNNGMLLGLGNYSSFGKLDVSSGGMVLLNDAYIARELNLGGGEFRGAELRLNSSAELSISAGTLSFESIHRDFSSTYNPELSALEFSGGILQFDELSTKFVDVRISAFHLHQTGGVVRAGNQTHAILIDGDYTMEGGILEIEMEQMSSHVAFDAVTITGDYNIAGGALDLQLLNQISFGLGDEFLIVDIFGSRNGFFEGLAQNAQVGEFNGRSIFIDYFSGDGNDIRLFTSAVPEPSSTFIFAASIGFVVSRRRRRV